MGGLFGHLGLIIRLCEETGCTWEEAKEALCEAMPRQEEPPKPNVEYESRWLQ